MASPIDFHFDFSSPYTYVASEEIEALAERTGSDLRWRPLLLGAVFKTSGGHPLTEGYGPKVRYSVRDFARAAAFVGVPYRHPSIFPIGTVSAARAVLWLKQQQPQQVAAFIHAVFRAFFVADRNISDTAIVLEIARSQGIDAEQLADGIQQDSIKSELKSEVEHAVTRGVFGSPTIFVDGEMFWGHDRLAHVERWISTGPF